VAFFPRLEVSGFLRRDLMKLILFGTLGCHLCESAEQLIAPIFTDNLSICIERIDIAEQTEWQPQYAIKIPVLLHPESLRELCWPFDRMAVITFIDELKHEQF
jgi:hypothetical protein